MIPARIYPRGENEGAAEIPLPSYKLNKERIRFQRVQQCKGALLRMDSSRALSEKKALSAKHLLSSRALSVKDIQKTRSDKLLRTQSSAPTSSADLRRLSSNKIRLRRLSSKKQSLSDVRRRSSKKGSIGTLGPFLLGGQYDATEEATSALCYSITANWMYIAAVLFETFHVPFRLSFYKSEEDVVWVAIGLALDATKVRKLLIHTRVLVSSGGFCSCSSFASCIIQILPLIPFNTIAWLLLLCGWYGSARHVWPVRLCQLSSWLALQGIHDSLELWSFERNSKVTKSFKVSGLQV
jgi:hypothetical protein